MLPPIKYLPRDVRAGSISSPSDCFGSPSASLRSHGSNSSREQRLTQSPEPTETETLLPSLLTDTTIPEVLSPEKGQENSGIEHPWHKIVPFLEITSFPTSRRWTDSPIGSLAYASASVWLVKVPRIKSPFTTIQCCPSQTTQPRREAVS